MRARAAPCARRSAPRNASSGERKQTHVIDETKCIRCGVCKDVCNFDAVKVE
ncbi:MAG: 4Fe-4S binding protein [Anaerotruncus sp.]|nr:4Fe-4S binding protein [Anaerotruncus sp.]